MSDYHRTYCASCGDWRVFENGACIRCKHVPGRMEQEIAASMEQAKMLSGVYDHLFPGLKGGGYGN